MAEGTASDMSTLEDTLVGTENQMNEIQAKIAAEKPPVGEVEDLRALSLEYEETDLVYQGKIESLLKIYKQIRRTRPDGCCFYRAFAFAYLEYLSTKQKEDIHRFKATMRSHQQRLLSLGYPDFTTSDVFDTFEEVVDQVEADGSSESLLKMFLEPSRSDYIVLCMRLIVSAELQHQNDFYLNFVQGYASMKEFCQKEVEPMYRDSDHLHVTALITAMETPVRVVYMDRGGDKDVNHHDFLEERGDPHITLLYRPGHYDLLYS